MIDKENNIHDKIQWWDSLSEAKKALIAAHRDLWVDFRDREIVTENRNIQVWYYGNFWLLIYKNFNHTMTYLKRS